MAASCADCSVTGLPDFVRWTAREAPGLFWGRIAGNPAQGPSRGQLFASAIAHVWKDLQVAVASGTRDSDERRQVAREWVADGSARKEAPWQVTLVQIEGGTHAARIGEGYRRALLRLFRDAGVPPLR